MAELIPLNVIGTRPDEQVLDNTGVDVMDTNVDDNTIILPTPDVDFEGPGALLPLEVRNLV